MKETKKELKKWKGSPCAQIERSMLLLCQFFPIRSTDTESYLVATGLYEEAGGPEQRTQYWKRAVRGLTSPSSKLIVSDSNQVWAWRKER